jgi:membrane protein implicated in regulation of membrane protease activity
MQGAISDWAPWLWIILAVALAAAEMVVPSFLLIWPAAAALVVGLLALGWPGIGLAAQVALFAALAVLATLGGRRYVMTHRPDDAHRPALNRRGSRLVGRRGRALEAFAGGRGPVEIDGERWSAVCDAAVAEGATVTVVSASGMELTVALSAA